jgi:uncharacterized repeat protein (TIGR01451 family)
VNNVKVTLTGTDDLGNPVNMETTSRRSSDTSDHGWYEFSGLRASDENGYVLTFTAPDGRVWTSRDAVGSGESTATPVDPDVVDSDVDGQGQVTVVVDADTDVSTVDAGIFTPVSRIEFSKAADKSQVKVGDVITFTMTGTNTGNITLYDVTVDDPMEGLTNKTCVFPGETGVLVPGQQVVCTAEYTVTEADADNGSIENTATIMVDPLPEPEPTETAEPEPTETTTGSTEPTETMTAEPTETVTEPTETTDPDPTDPTTVPEPTESTTDPEPTSPTTDPESTEPTGEPTRSTSAPAEETTSSTETTGPVETTVPTSEPEPSMSATYPTEPTVDTSESASATESVVPAATSSAPAYTQPATEPTASETASASQSPAVTVQVAVDGPTEASAQVVIAVTPTANTGGTVTGTSKWVALVAGLLALVTVGLFVIRHQVVR